MEFLSLPFLVCMAATFVLYYARGTRRWQHAVLLLASMVFIGYYHLSYLLMASGITVFTFLLGKKVHATLDTPACARWLWTGIVALVAFWLLARYWFSLFP